MNKRDKEQVIKDLNNMRNSRSMRIWKPFMVKYDCQRIAEVGVRTGYNFWKMIKHNPKLAVAVDIWRDDGVIGRNDIQHTQEQLDGEYEKFVRNYGYLPFVKVCREYSFDAAGHFPDNYFDLVYIDADHTYEGCLKDIEAWYPKVKKDRFLIGDDYRHHTTKTGVKFGVIEAVEEFTKKNKLDYFTFPRSKWGLIK